MNQTIEQSIEQKVRNTVKKTNGKFFTVNFLKKDGSERTMLCRTHVKKHLRGGKKTTPETAITVYSINDKGYRCFYPDTVMGIKCGNINESF